MALVGSVLADDIRSTMGFPLPTSTQLLGWGAGIVTHLQTSALISFAPNLVTGIAPFTGGALTNGAAANGRIAGISGAALAALVKADAGYPFVSTRLTAMCTAICLHIVTNARVSFATGTVTGTCSNIFILPSTTVAGTFTGTGTAGIITGLIGNQMADEVHAAVGYPGVTSTRLKEFCSAITTYVMASATCLGGAMTGVAPAGGGAITSGAGTGGTIL